MLYGVIDSISSVTSLKYIANNPKCLEIYYDILIYNFICIIFHYFVSFLYSINKNIQYFNWLLIIGWYIPQYLFSLLYHIYYSDKIINLLFTNKQSNMKWSLVCAYSIYSQLILLISNIIPIFIPNHNILFQFFHFIYNSLLNSFYFYIPFWRKNNYTIDIQIRIVENSLFYYLGYGCIFSIMRLYLDFYVFHYIYSILYPLLAIYPFLDNCTNSGSGYSLPSFFSISKYISNYIIFLIQLYNK